MTTKVVDYEAASTEWSKDRLTLPHATPYVLGHRAALHHTRYCGLTNRKLQIIIKLASVGFGFPKGLVPSMERLNTMM